ncbi:hypothetical protein K227x_55690 [Rubripirellula lacrimiformis]|uniref:Uncharacterized protein n=1 Tax=Rubripirellula lacrimiformis TaxID=1930273 RepID=A0A517NJ38_9BACT|nr:hypothetical protein [Rubripirellula lacrimiformis]QDT07144.1 hypothetical protein K227x_55690 [Rubripirellula lacrimiformis]
MSKRTMTGSDVFHMAIVAVPILALAGTIGAATVSWRSHQTRLEQAIRDVTADGTTIDHSTQLRRYDANSSKDATATWKAILAATEDYNAVYGGPFAWEGDESPYEQLVPPGQDWVAAEVIHQYAQGAEPILQKIDSLLDSGDTIWTPLVAEAFEMNLNEVQKSRALARLLRYVFLDAVHQGDSQRAIMTIRATDRFFGPSQQSFLMVGELVQIACYSVTMAEVRRSIAADVWTDEELAEIKSIIDKPSEWDRRWRSVVESELYSYLPVLMDGKIGSSLSRQTAAPLPLGVAPSSLISVVQMQQELINLPVAQRYSEIDKARQITEDHARKPDDASMDRLLQVPFTSSDWLTDLLTPAYGALAGAFSRVANEQRYTRTVLATRQFERQFHRWPESLDELGRVGLPQSETQAFDGGPFAFEVDAQDQMTIYLQSNRNTDWSHVLGRDPEVITLVPGAGD